MSQLNGRIKKFLQSSFPPERMLRNYVKLSQTTCSNSRNDGIKAAVCEELGKPLKIKTLPRPSMEEHEVRIGVHYAAVNFGDVLQIQGKYQEKPRLPFVPGAEFSGKITQVSKGEEDFEVGDHVAAISLKPCALAEEACVPKGTIFKIPKSVPLQYGAASLTSYGTAWLALKRTANIQEGQTVFVSAAAGAVGLALVDLAANIFGCNVIGAVGSDAKAKIVLEKGAKHVVNYTNENIRFVKEKRERLI
ncbi:DgyrCDS13733 [Dimorphilus gyrociliatus]|uniref:DgyrCDS13733 n=1 Tax=Dimorphilus gyrociliatus TaxID=2664684 RepID=A0A7I8WBL0_9ANNE|nr:DgyrCDS13733 [Dimorphilus gyrociliatus]